MKTFAPLESLPVAKRELIPGLTCEWRGSPRLLNTGEFATTEHLVQLWQNFGPAMIDRLTGPYAISILDSNQQRALLSVDRFAIHNLCYRISNAVLSFSERADEAAGEEPELNAQALFDYLYFHIIPAPNTIFQSVQRLRAGHCLVVDRTGTRLVPPKPMPVTTMRTSLPDSKRELFQLLRASVQSEMDSPQKIGCFLSGGLDSSAIAGIMSQLNGPGIPSYSIGFWAEGYDEMSYARLAAKQFGCEHHHYYVTPEDIVEKLPNLAGHFEQPFGNSSALPTYCCAQLAAADGCGKLLAGDGGDELFGGNTRYASEQFLEYYHWLPQALRQRLDPLCKRETVLRRIPGLRQLTGYVRQACLPMPHRLMRMNLLMHLGPEALLAPQILSKVKLEGPSQLMQGRWDECPDGPFIYQMLNYDWGLTLSDNDLVKVQNAGQMTGIQVGFPMLDERLVGFSTGLPARWKLQHLQLRRFYRKAMQGFLPDPLLERPKQGFSLPTGIWIDQSTKLRAFAREALGALSSRGILQPNSTNKLLEHYLPRTPRYYGEMIWVLMFLEHWLRAHPRLKVK